MDDDRMAKLPKWARDAFMSMERELERLRKQVYPEGEAWCFLPRDVPIAFGAPSSYDGVRFKRGADSRDFFYVKLSKDGSSIRINASHGLLIAPHVTNSITLFLDKEGLRG